MNTEIKPHKKSLWQHYNGVKYEVIHLANLETTNEEKYPVTVIYQGINGKVWARPLKDWHKSFKQI